MVHTATVVLSTRLTISGGRCGGNSSNCIEKRRRKYTEKLPCQLADGVGPNLLPFCLGSEGFAGNHVFCVRQTSHALGTTDCDFSTDCSANNQEWFGISFYVGNA